MRCVGIDWGERRWGLAYGDELGVATPMPALLGKTAAARWEELAQVCLRRRVTEFVVGYPLNMDDSAGFKAKEVDGFVAKLKEKFGLPVHLVDERLTSYEAEQGMSASRKREVRAQGIVDSRAATLLLQDYLSQRFPLP